MSIVGSKVKCKSGQNKNMIGTITDEYGEYVYVDFPDRAKKGKNTEVSIKLSDLELLKENMKESKKKEPVLDYKDDILKPMRDLKVGQEYVWIMGMEPMLVTYTGPGKKEFTYNFAFVGKPGKHDLSIRDVKDFIKFKLDEGNKMKSNTQVKLRRLIERLIREETVNENFESFDDFATSISSDSQIKAMHDKVNKQILLTGPGLSYAYIGKMLSKLGLHAKVQKSGKNFIVLYARTTR